MNTVASQSELFSVEPPRLLYVKASGVQTRRNERLAVDDPQPGETYWPWFAWSGEFSLAKACGGDSEEEAVTAWALANGVKALNEESK